MAAALAGTIADVEAAGGSGRFNFLATDGHAIAATACGDTLWYRRCPGGADVGTADAGTADAGGAGAGGAGAVTVASEPTDDEPGWTEVPGRHVLTATPVAVSVRPLNA